VHINPLRSAYQYGEQTLYRTLNRPFTVRWTDPLPYAEQTLQRTLHRPFTVHLSGPDGLFIVITLSAYTGIGKASVPHAGISAGIFLTAGGAVRPGEWGTHFFRLPADILRTQFPLQLTHTAQIRIRFNTILFGGFNKAHCEAKTFSTNFLEKLTKCVNIMNGERQSVWSTRNGERNTVYDWNRGG